tara:strand:- start:728 stop:1357 length:630 start_codon:yes stop_codon:yes gene_type:complete
MAIYNHADYSENLSSTQRIIFHQEISGKAVDFKAFDLTYSESITTDWDETVLPRRTNRSYAWAGTTRSISLAWSMPAFDIVEAKLNFQKCALLVQMMYPGVNKTTGAVEGGTPYWKMGVMNWAHSGGESGAAGTTSDTLLTGFPRDFSFNIVASDGYLYEDNSTSPYPKHLKASISYTVILDDSKFFGWNGGQWQGPKHFPWDESPSDN